MSYINNGHFSLPPEDSNNGYDSSDYSDIINTKKYHKNKKNLERMMLGILEQIEILEIQLKYSQDILSPISKGYFSTTDMRALQDLSDKTRTELVQVNETLSQLNKRFLELYRPSDPD
jgi:hypothetical protein